MDSDEVVRRLRLAAIERLMGSEVGSDRLIQLAVEALLAGVEAVSLSQLAGLTRAEEPDASALFECVVAELKLLPLDLPAEPSARTGALVWWWAQLLVDAELDMHTGAELIYRHGRDLLDTHDYEPLRALVASTVHYDDEITNQAIWDSERYRRRRTAGAEVIDRARDLLAQPPPWQGSITAP
jgi:hypothetical protein